MADVCILDYGIGNITSVCAAFHAIGADPRVADRPESVASPDLMVIPGVGAFGACISALRAKHFDDILSGHIEASRGVLGICVGMQMLFEWSQESPEVLGLGYFSGTVERMPRTSEPLPEMQWNRVLGTQDPLTTGVNWAYFVHSYAVAYSPYAVAHESYDGHTWVAAVANGPVIGVQFHPERSSLDGRRFLGQALARIREYA